MVDSGLKPETKSAAAEGSRCQLRLFPILLEEGRAEPGFVLSSRWALRKVEASGFLAGILGTMNVLRRILDTFGHIYKLSVLVR